MQAMSGLWMFGTGFECQIFGSQDWNQYIVLMCDFDTPTLMLLMSRGRLSLYEHPSTTLLPIYESPQPFVGSTTRASV